MKPLAERWKIWLAMGLVLIALAHIGIGVRLLLPGSSQVVVSWLAKPTMAAVQTSIQAPIAHPTRTSSPTMPLLPKLSPLPTLAMLPDVTQAHSPVSLPTLAMLPTFVPSPSPISAPALAVLPTATDTPQPAPTSTAQFQGLAAATAFSLTIVHTNDTWGYTRPCG